MHPAEFLLCEFLHKFKDKIKVGKKVKLFVAINRSKFNSIYMPLIDRFFKLPKDFNMIIQETELNLNKERVKAILQD